MKPTNGHHGSGRFRLATPVLVIATAASLIALSMMTDEQRFIATPALACTVVMLWFGVALWDKEGEVPLFEVGFFCALATFAYSVYPLINYWVHGFQFGTVSDLRLYVYAPSPAEIGTFHYRHVLYLSCFTVFYLLFRGKGPIRSAVAPPPLTTRYMIVTGFLGLSLYFIALRFTTGLVFQTSYEQSVIADKVATYASAPLLLVQISGKLVGLLFVLKLALLYIVVSRARRPRWMMLLIVWIAAEVIHSFLLKGPRSAVVLFLLTTVLLYHRLVRPLSFKVLAMCGGGVFALFTFLGLYRSFSDLDALRLDIKTADAGVFARSNEFQALLGTAYDVAQRKAAGTPMPWYLYINDFIDILPPQQLLPFAKVSASEWYLRELGVSGTGQGYMWGVITQSIAGRDWVELAIRGSILGLILAWVHRWYRNRQSRFIETFVYMYLCIHVYYTFRNTTFSILANVVWELIPFYVIASLSAALMSRARRPQHPIAERAPAPILP
jgi:hypothetical protein